LSDRRNPNALSSPSALMARYIDLTFPLEEAMPVWPGDLGTEFREGKNPDMDFSGTAAEEAAHNR
jgi:kynurenine formamidase